LRGPSGRLELYRDTRLGGRQNKEIAGGGLQKLQKRVQAVRRHQDAQDRPAHRIDKTLKRRCIQEEWDMGTKTTGVRLQRVRLGFSRGLQGRPIHLSSWRWWDSLTSTNICLVQSAGSPRGALLSAPRGRPTLSTSTQIPKAGTAVKTTSLGLTAHRPEGAKERVGPDQGLGRGWCLAKTARRKWGGYRSLGG